VPGTCRGSDHDGIGFDIVGDLGKLAGRITVCRAVLGGYLVSTGFLDLLTRFMRDKPADPHPSRRRPRRPQPGNIQPISSFTTARPEAPLTPGAGQVAAPINQTPGMAVR
jgi:hypothetical protein